MKCHTNYRFCKECEWEMKINIFSSGVLLSALNLENFINISNFIEIKKKKILCSNQNQNSLVLHI